ncbi:MAG: hypothetical protein H8D96_08555 [Desulfobacterales bacterium]|uniref:Uncharacterized protein n=1 Tax=Candidatus Desulfatibia vada TaxID=2841696 RepID=A0A8J6P0E7_9BACT|nr:hypothetical protein [Candidatus Desulfatibia vada]MBL6972121.1 hypothetical protein [Desulfobacterales bacterium]
MKAENKKKETAPFRKIKSNKKVLSEQFQTQALYGLDIVIRRRKGKQDKRIVFSEKGQ